MWIDCHSDIEPVRCTGNFSASVKIGKSRTQDLDDLIVPLPSGIRIGLLS